MKMAHTNEEIGSIYLPNKTLNIPAIGKITKKIENIGSRWPVIGRLYSTLLYAGVVEREEKLAGLEPGSSILHVGCGSLPFTALALARKGYLVTAVDSDPASIAAARRFIEAEEPGADITLITGNGSSIDTSLYDAVWVSLNVSPKRDVLKHLLSGMREGAKLIYRNPRQKKGYADLYDHIRPETLGGDLHKMTIPTDRVKEAVLMVKRSVSNNEGSTEGTCRCRISLEELGPGQPARILHTPDYSLIPPLGLRPGKEVIVRCRHPIGGPIVLSVEGRRVALAREFARQIIVA